MACSACGVEFEVHRDWKVTFWTYQRGKCVKCGQVVNICRNGLVREVHYIKKKTMCPGYARPAVRQTHRAAAEEGGAG
jgi:predicted molibdopterin-dependent oxidoreductase YjgC